MCNTRFQSASWDKPALREKNQHSVTLSSRKQRYIDKAKSWSASTTSLLPGFVRMSDRLPDVHSFFGMVSLFRTNSKAHVHCARWHGLAQAHCFQQLRLHKCGRISQFTDRSCHEQVCHRLLRAKLYSLSAALHSRVCGTLEHEQIRLRRFVAFASIQHSMHRRRFSVNSLVTSAASRRPRKFDPSTHRTVLFRATHS